MKLRKWWYDAKTTKWQIVFGVFIIFFLFVVPFSLLDQIEWDPDWKHANFVDSILATMLGGVAVAIITGVLIIFQNVVGMDREKNQKIFDKRVELYKNFLEQTMAIIDDDVLEDHERKNLMVIEKDILMIASPETYAAWYDVYRYILKLPRTVEEMNKLRDNPNDEKEHSNRVQKIAELTTYFVNQCRKDLQIEQIKSSLMKEINEENKLEIKKHLFTGGADVTKNN
ncbi:MAG: hypothetical protein CMP56_00440 [Flavobacteriales bacterium]|nr:hypothetical protein [Flavobacteriales bacterium]